MAYSDVSALRYDGDYFNRVTACAATESIANPDQWATDHVWQMAAMPGFGDRYASAIVNGVPRPGNDQSVISDGDILSAVQSLNTA